VAPVPPAFQTPMRVPVPRFWGPGMEAPRRPNLPVREFSQGVRGERIRYLFAVAGYVVMPEHVHLLVNEPVRGLLSRAVQALKLSVSMRSRERPFWQAHYYDFNVSSHGKFVEKLRYIHRNPVARGLCAKAEEWRWSSYRHDQTGMHGTVEIESEWTACERGRQLPEWMRYRQFDSPFQVPKGEGPGRTRFERILCRSGPPARG
jgi:REP-associated tyrosine transposase